MIKGESNRSIPAAFANCHLHICTKAVVIVTAAWIFGENGGASENFELQIMELHLPPATRHLQPATFLFMVVGAAGAVLL